MENESRKMCLVHCAAHTSLLNVQNSIANIGTGIENMCIKNLEVNNILWGLMLKLAGLDRVKSKIYRYLGELAALDDAPVCDGTCTPHGSKIIRTTVAKSPTTTGLTFVFVVSQVLTGLVRVLTCGWRQGTSKNHVRQ